MNRNKIYGFLILAGYPFTNKEDEINNIILDGKLRKEKRLRDEKMIELINEFSKQYPVCEEIYPDSDIPNIVRSPETCEKSEVLNRVMMIDYTKYYKEKKQC